MDVKHLLLEKIKDGSFALLTDEQIAKLLHLGKREAQGLRDMLRSLCREGELLFDSLYRYGTADQFGAMKGIYSANERGFGFVTPENGSPDLFIPRRAAGGALHGDLVLAFAKEGDEGEILSVLERGKKEVVGTYRKEGRAGYLLPDERRYAAKIYIPAGKQRGCRDGCKAVAKLTAFGEPPTGEITEVLGQSGDFFTEELALIRAHKLREEFPAEVLREAEAQEARGLHPKDLAGRLDLRKELIITVDGEDTRDIDDAISVKKTGERFELGVHIADVSHYVSRGSALDGEAFARGTSVYFPDRVLPMLPAAISNGICSLNEGEDRLTLSCLMTVDGKGRVLKRRIVPSVINSRHRMTYSAVTALAGGNEEEKRRYPDLVAFVGDAVELTEVLKEARRARGSVGLDIKEAKIVYRGGKIDIPEHERTISEEMIEEFMVLANESVAEIMTEKKAPFLYRVHEPPSPDKAREFLLFLSEAGIRANFGAQVSPADYGALLERLKGSPLFSLVNRVMLRSMMKARYSPENMGHFGLASKCYCHFTSPIRRYPDLAVHRIIKESLAGADLNKYHEFVKEAAVRSSECERNAQDAERDVDALYTAAYMQDKIGEIYLATVSGVTSFGLFAELKNTVEGLIPIETLPEDYYELIEERHMLRGTKHSYRLGEEVTVKVTGIDRGARRTQFMLVEQGEKKR